MLEVFERRQLLANTAFIQGVAFVDDGTDPNVLDASDTRLPNATIQLHKLDSPSIPDQSTTTDANGAYLFQNLPAGQYRVTEVPPTGYANSASEAKTQLIKVLGSTASSIDVALSEPTETTLKFPSFKIMTVTTELNGVQRSEQVGQINVQATIPGIGYTPPLFPTFCIDYFHSIQGNQPYTFEPLTNKVPQNAGRIAYLYNHFGSNWLTPGQSVTKAEAAGFQLAIWELEYETQTPYDVTTGNFKLVGQVDPQVAAFANSYIAMSEGKSELAVALNGLPTQSRPNGSQDLLTTSTFNFANIPSAPGPLPGCIEGTVFAECDNDGIQQTGEQGIAGVTITLTGTDNLGQPVTLVTTTDQDGKYAFENLAAGTYTVTQGPTPGYLQGKTTAGTGGGTVSGDTISNIVVPEGVCVTDYNFSELHPSSLSGVVYYDLNHNGTMDSPDFGITGVTVTLNGTNDLGQSIHMTTVTNDDGFYSFNNLRPGTYEIVRTQPPIFHAYKNNLGSLGGVVKKNAFASISVTACAEGVDYNFGELQNPNCRLRYTAIHVGNTVDRLRKELAQNPTQFYRKYPKIGPIIAAGQVPKGIGTFPKAPLVYHWVPKVGTKPISLAEVYGHKATATVRAVKHTVVKVVHAAKATVAKALYRR